MVILRFFESDRGRISTPAIRLQQNAGFPAERNNAAVRTA